MFVLIALAAAGAALYGLPGALVGYVVGLVVASFLPQPRARTSCRVEPSPPPSERPERSE
ncbi:MAG: hypothetical protein ACC662_02445 [Planctomycetota bacterium]